MHVDIFAINAKDMQPYETIGKKCRERAVLSVA